MCGGEYKEKSHLRVSRFCFKVGDGEDGIYLDNRKLKIMMAQEKGDVEEKQKEREKKEPKDNRNLYLSREGIIREGNVSLH